jgi:aspartate kinase
MIPRRRSIVLKFGGAALSDPSRAIQWIRQTQQGAAPVVVVVSAREGVTDRLLGALPSSGSRPAVDRLLTQLRREHPGVGRDAEPIFEAIRRGLRGTRGSATIAAARIDMLGSQGERLAAHWFTHELNRAGLPATALEADRLGLRTDNRFGSARILIDRSRARVARGIARVLSEDRIPVVTGFFGQSLAGPVATLGRGGSDYSATAIGAIVSARRVELVKQRVSIRSADPRWVGRTRPLRYLSYEEAEELAQFGARVLHSWAIEPARSARVPVVVRSLEDPHQATTVGPPMGHDTPRALTVVPSLELLALRVPGGRDRPGVMADVTRRLADVDVNVVQLYTSSALLCVLIDRADTTRARRALSGWMHDREMTVDSSVRAHLLIAIGDRILHDVGRLPPPILRSALGLTATSKALSVAIRETDLGPVLRALHRALVEAPHP